MHVTRLNAPLGHGCTPAGAAAVGGPRRRRACSVGKALTPERARRRAPGSSLRASEAGQAAVEFVALLPVLMLVALAMGQGAVAGYAAWSAAGAARMAARAEALGEKPGEAARDELPRFLDRGSRIKVASPTGKTPGRVTVRLRVPSLVPGLRFGTVAGRAQLPGQVLS